MASFYNLPGDPPVEIPFVRGQKAIVGTVQLEVGATQKIDPKQQPQFPVYDYNGQPDQNANRWSIILGISNVMTPFAATYTALDGSGKPIAYVNRKGKEISGMQYLEEMQKSDPRHGPRFNPNPSNGNAYLQASGPSAAGAFTLTTDIDPGQIGKIRVTTMRQRRVLITGFPLEPSS